MSVKHTIFQSKPARKNADQTNLANSTLREAVIAVLIACRYLIDSLAQQLEQGMIRSLGDLGSSIWEAAPVRRLNR
jgi:hypothetical protein